MSGQYQIKFEYINPTNIESEVPGLQSLREADLESPAGKCDENLEEVEDQTEDEDSNFVPVMTVTKQETALTKGDLKLQKVSVTENISDEENDRQYVTAVNPAYSMVHSKVMQSQPIRTEPEYQDSADSSKEDNDQVEQKKPKTRIPTFKQTAEKVKKDKKDERDKKEEEAPPPEKRRSSIPKLNKISKIPSAKNSSKGAPVEKTRPKAEYRGIPLPVKDRNVKKHTEIPIPVKDISVKVDVKNTPIVERANIEKSTLPVKQNTDTAPTVRNYSNKEIYSDETNDTDIKVTTKSNAEDEFDKIYDEIFDTAQAEEANYEKFSFGSPISIGDPEKLEMRFEDIIHAYDEKEVQRDVTDKYKSPLLKQKSLHEVIIPKQVPRRLSLEDLPNDDSLVTQTTQVYNDKKIEDMNNIIEEQEIEQHSMIYTNKPAEFEIITYSPIKKDDIIPVEKPVSQNTSTQVYEESYLGDMNNRIEEQEIEQHSMIYTNEPAEFEIITHSSEKEGIMPNDNLVYQNTATQVHDENYLGDMNNRIEEQEIEQHSMIYTSEPAEFEIITHSSEKGIIPNDNLVCQNTATQVHEERDISDMNNRIEEQEIEQHSMIYTNEPAEFEIITHSSEKKGIIPNDNLVYQNTATQVHDENYLGDMNNRIEKQEIEQHSMIYTSEPAEFEIITHSSEKGIIPNDNLVCQNTATQVHEERDISDMNNRIEEQEIEQHSMIYTHEPAQFEIITQVTEKDDINAQLITLDNINEPLINVQTENKLTDVNKIPYELQETVYISDKYENNKPEAGKINISESELKETSKVDMSVSNDDNLIYQNTAIEVHNEQHPTDIHKSYSNRIEEDEIEYHSIMYTNEPALIEIVTQLREKESDRIGTQSQELDYTQETLISIQNDTAQEEAINLINIPQELNEPVSIPDKDETTQRETGMSNIIQPNIKETVKIAIPVFNDKNINNDDKLLVKESITEEKHTDQYKPKLENQSSTSEVPDSSQMVLNILSIIRNNSLDKDAPNATEERLEKEVSISQEPDLWEEIHTEVYENKRDSNTDNSLQVKEDFIINKIDRLNVDKPKKEHQDEIPKKAPVKSKIAVFAKDKGVGLKDKSSQSPTRSSNTASTIDTHRDESKLKAADVHKSEQTRKKLTETDNLKHTENKYQTNSRSKSKHDTSDIKEEPKPLEPIAANSEISEITENNSKSENNHFKDDKSPDPERVLKINKETPIVRGNVSSIISRLDSQDDSKVTQKKEVANEIPKKKSVLSRIAMFEDYKHQTSKPTPGVQLLTSTKETEPREPVLKPKVIDQVLKTQTAVDNADVKYDEAKVEIIRNEAIFTAGRAIVGEEISHNLTDDNVFEEKLIPSKEQDKLFNIGDEKINRNDHRSNKKSTQDVLIPTVEVDKPSVFENLASVNAVENKLASPAQDFKEYNRQNKDCSNKTKEMPSIESRLQRMISTNEQSNMRRTKSVAELDLGDAVKGKVHQMIVRINSMENLVDAEKKDFIKVTERPRKRSVSEKIALFEKKLSPVNMDDQTGTKPNEGRNDRNRTSPETLTEEEITERIADLTNAKIKHGRMDQMICIPLRNGVEMPALAVGTAMLHPSLIHNIIGAAIDLGYRAIDTAFIYGNERQVGEAIRAKIDDGTVTREELFIISKLWSTYHRQDLVAPACRASLAAMGLEYFDLYLIHNPMSFKEGGDPVPKIANVLQYSESDYMDAWYGMEGLIAKGLAKSIGVSNFNSTQLARVYEKGRVKPVVNQVECHPYLSQQRLDQSCGERDVRLSCFGVLGSKGTPGDLKSNQSPVIDDPLVKVMAAAMNVSPAQLLVRYQIESGHGVVVKSSTAAHLWDNLQAMAFNITSTELDALNALNRNKRTYTFKGMGDTHRNYPFRTPY